jgi:hypothetical protein
MSDDPDIRDRFASLRREEAARTPAFEQVLRRAHPARRGIGSWVTAGSLMAVVGLAALLWRSPHRSPGPEVMAAAISQWRAPTDFLLNTPGMDMLRTIPRIGEPADAIPSIPELNLKPALPAKTEHRS